MFTYNTSTARTYPSTGSQQRSAGKLTADMDASAAHHVLNVELERAYSHPFPKGSGRAANLEKEEHVLTESHLNEKIGYA